MVVVRIDKYIVNIIRVASHKSSIFWEIVNALYLMDMEMQQSIASAGLLPPPL